MISIYALTNPIDDKVFYIGATHSPSSRLSAHINGGKKLSGKKDIYIKSLLSQGERPKMEIIHTCAGFHAWFWEEHYIQLYRSWGFDLLQESKNKTTYYPTIGFKNYLKGKNLDVCDNIRRNIRWDWLRNINSLNPNFKRGHSFAKCAPDDTLADDNLSSMDKKYIIEVLSNLLSVK